MLLLCKGGLKTAPNPIQRKDEPMTTYEQGLHFAVVHTKIVETQ